MAKDGERTLSGLARRVEVFLDLVIFNELRKIAAAEDTTVNKILTQIVIEYFRERGVPRRAAEGPRHPQRPSGGSAKEAPQAGNAAAGQQPNGATGDQPSSRRRRRRRRGGRGPKPDAGSGEGGGESAA